MCKVLAIYLTYLLLKFQPNQTITEHMAAISVKGLLIITNLSSIFGIWGVLTYLGTVGSYVGIVESHLDSLGVIC